MKRILLAVVFASCFISLFGQGSFYITSLPGFPGQAVSDQTYSFGVNVKNADTTAFSGVVRIMYNTDSMPTPAVMASDSSVNNIGAGDTVYIPVNNFKFDNVYFRDGVNVVVIWPEAAPGVSPADTMTVNVTVTIINGVVKTWESLPLLYPNPARDKLVLKELNAGMNNKRVRIYNLNGEIVHSGDYRDIVDINYLKTGNYLLEISGNEGVKVLRFIKE